MKRKPHGRSGKPRASTEAPTPVQLNDGKTSCPDALNALLRDRCHGAANIRGIRFQLRYSILRATQLALSSRQTEQTATEALHFEGLEDVDYLDGPALKGLSVETGSSRECVQVKMAAEPWSWHKLAEPLSRFLEVSRAGSLDARFRLVVSFPLRKDLESLSRLDMLKPADNKAIREKFQRLARSVGGTEREANHLLDRLRVEQISEEELQLRLRQSLADLTSSSDVFAVEAYELMIAGQALTWAGERAQVSGKDVNELVLRSREGLVRSEHFTAVSGRLISRVSFSPDTQPGDFFEGKRVRFGHIADGLDVRRPKWLLRIDEALASARVAVIRAPSGQGKSTLAFRYVLENWPEGETIIVRSVKNEEELGALEDYLRFRASLRLPIRVLLDADYRTPLWPRLAAEVSALGGQLLVTVRVEDWRRFSIDSLARREIIEPTLDREEAKEIYAVFSARKRVHPTVDSAAWAFERLRTPCLLLEFVYLITQGQMLEERLRDQVRGFLRLGEDPGKLQLLRIAALSSALGAPIPADSLLTAIQLRDDPQEVVAPLLGEYLSLEDGLFESLHWVRSEHLARILHEDGVPSITSTALTAASLVPAHALRFVVTNALGWDGIDSRMFLDGLIERFKEAPLSTLRVIVEGLFEAGETAFFQANRAKFDQAFARLGAGGLLLLLAEIAPIVPAKVITQLSSTLDARNTHLPFLLDLISTIEPVSRGLDLVSSFLRQVSHYQGTGNLVGATRAELGQFLDWCGLARVSLPSWDEARHVVLAARIAPGESAESLATFSQGLFRFDRKAFDTWYESHEHDLLAVLQFATRTLSLRVTRPSGVLDLEGRGMSGHRRTAGEDRLERSASQSEDDARRVREDAERFGEPLADIEIIFAVASGTSRRPHDHAVERLKLLRGALPFAGYYCSQGDYFLPSELSPPVDDTVKRIPRWNLPLPSDVGKQVVSKSVITRAYLPDSVYRLEEVWYRFRKLALNLVQAHSAVLARELQGKTAQFEKNFGDSFELVQAFQDASTTLPDTSRETLSFIDPVIASALEPALCSDVARGLQKWLGRLTNFSNQIWEFRKGREERVGRLMQLNLRQATDHLPRMHAFFRAFFEEAPDYFEASALDPQESSAYPTLLLLIDGLLDPLRSRPLEPLKELRRRSQARDKELIEAVSRTLANVAADLEIQFVLPTRVHSEDGLKACAVGVEVGDLATPQVELAAISLHLRPLASLVDWIWLIPLDCGARVGENGYRVTASRLEQDDATCLQDKSWWWQFFPVPVPAEILDCLPPLRVLPPPEPGFAQKLLGLRTFAEPYLRRRRLIEQIEIGRSHPLLKELTRLERQDLADIERELIQLIDSLELELGATQPLVPGVPEGVIDAMTKLKRFFSELRSLVVGNEVDADYSIPDLEEVQGLLVELGGPST